MEIYLMGAVPAVLVNELWGPGTGSTILEAALVDGRLEVVRRRPSHTSYADFSIRLVPDTVWREVYEARDGQVVLATVTQGVHFPGYSVRESISFDGKPWHPNRPTGPCGVVDEVVGDEAGNETRDEVGNKVGNETRDETGNKVVG